MHLRHPDAVLQAVQGLLARFARDTHPGGR
jgi:hypothetical protein